MTHVWDNIIVQAARQYDKLTINRKIGGTMLDKKTVDQQRDMIGSNRDSYDSTKKERNWNLFKSSFWQKIYRMMPGSPDGELVMNGRPKVVAGIQLGYSGAELIQRFKQLIDASDRLISRETSPILSIAKGNNGSLDPKPKISIGLPPEAVKRLEFKARFYKEIMSHLDPSTIYLINANDLDAYDIVRSPAEALLE